MPRSNATNKPEYDKQSVAGTFAGAVGKIKDLINYGGEKPAEAPKKKDGVFNYNTKNLLKRVGK
jgi:hypothetical protein